MQPRRLFRVYPLSRKDNPPAMTFVNASGKFHNTIHRMDFGYWEELNATIQAEPLAGLDVETLGLLASIGIEKGQAFKPDARMKKILTEAAEVGDITARALAYKSRIPDAYFYKNSAWNSPFIDGSYQFLKQKGVRNLAARTYFHFFAPGIPPGRARHMPPHSWTPRAIRSMAARPTRSTFLPRSRPSGSGRSHSMTTSRVRCSRPTSSSRASRA